MTATIHVAQPFLDDKSQARRHHYKDVLEKENRFHSLYRNLTVFESVFNYCPKSILSFVVKKNLSSNFNNTGSEYLA